MSTEHLRIDHDLFQGLADALPPLEIQTQWPIETQARWVMNLIVSRVLTEENTLDSKASDPSACPNCDKPCEAQRTPYCRVKCREEAAYVRQFRTGVAEGSMLDEERQVAFGQNLWHLIGGGFPLRRTLVTDKNRLKVIARDGGKCYYCDEPATLVDHIGTGCGRPINLRPVCAVCAKTRAFGEQAVLDLPDVQENLNRIAMRIGSPEPIRCCDDGATWDWRAYLKLRDAFR